VEIEHVLDQLAQAAGFLPDDLDGPPAFSRIADAIEQQGVGEHPDLCERCAQLVRDAGHEIFAKLRQLALAPQLPEADRDHQRVDDHQPDHQRVVRSGAVLGPQRGHELGRHRRAYAQADRVIGKHLGRHDLRPRRGFR
jgi:hypothetical protein